MDANGPKPLILVADDAPENIDILVAAIGPGYRASVAINAERVFALCRQSELPDLILLDVLMPGIDGYEACRRLKADERTKDIPVIFVTAQDAAHDETAGLAAGAVDYITKPINAQIVRARIRAHMALYHQQRELKQAYENLRKLERLRDGLIHMIVHDLRNPLMSIEGFLDMAKLAIERGDREKSVLYVSRPKAALDKMAAMVNELLDVSRLEANAMPLAITDSDFRDIIAETLRGQAVHERRLRAVMPEAPVPVRCDASLLGRVIGNLVSNALKFSPAGESVVIRLEPMPDAIRVSVADRGPGIPEAYLQRVFDRFFQVEMWRQKDIPSTGLGLTFCKLAVERHGGHIGVDSIEGQGAVFWFEVPANAEASHD